MKGKLSSVQVLLTGTRALSTGVLVEKKQLFVVNKCTTEHLLSRKRYPEMFDATDLGKGNESSELQGELNRSG